MPVIHLPDRRIAPLSLEQLTALARDVAAGAEVPAEDEVYRRTVLARLSGGADILMLPQPGDPQ